MNFKKILSNLFMLLGLFGFILAVSTIDSWNTATLLIIGIPLSVILWGIYIWLEIRERRVLEVYWTSRLGSASEVTPAILNDEKGSIR